MKKTFFFMLTISIISCNNDKFKVDCLPANLQNGVIAFYPFNGGSLDDESTNSNNITNTTTARPTTDRNGNPNCAFQFNNMQPNEEFLTATDANFLNGLNEFSVSIWYEPMDTTRNVGDFEILIARGNENKCYNRIGEWSVGLYDCRRAVFGHNNSVWANLIAGFGCKRELNTLTGRWHHVVATKKGDEYKIYFNGNLGDSKSGNYGCNSRDIGAMLIGSKYTGKIDDILIYKRELSQSEVTQLFALEPCCQ